MLPTTFFKKLIEFEGEYSNHINDPGGETIYGIAKNRDVEAFILVEKYYSSNMKTEALMTAKDVYDIKYYQKASCEVMENSNIMNSIIHQVFDMAVNMGVKTSIKILQKSINKYNRNTKVIVDGSFGPSTLAELIKCNNTTLNNVIVDERIDYYKNLCIKNPKLNTFINGWTNRANYFKFKA